MDLWHSGTGYRNELRLGSFNAWHLLRCGLAAILVVLISGCAGLWPAPAEPEPEPEAVQYSYAPLPAPEPVKAKAPEPAPPAPEKVAAPETPQVPVLPEKTTHDQVILLPKTDLPLGGVVVRTDSVVILLNKAYASALVEGPGMLTESTYDADLAQRNFSDVLAALPGKPAKFLLYFLEGKDELTPQSNGEVDKIFAELATRPAPEILVIGHTDAVGPAQFNDKLSLQRAEHVRAELILRGIPERSIAVEGRGEREPIVPTPDGVAEPMNRPVEINVR